MPVNDFESLKAHVGHNIRVIQYSWGDDPETQEILNVTMKCGCNEELLSYDSPELEEDKNETESK